MDGTAPHCIEGAVAHLGGLSKSYEARVAKRAWILKPVYLPKRKD